MATTTDVAAANREWDRSQPLPPALILVNGIEGYGDRLQTLLFAMLLGVKLNRPVWCNWLDSVWSGKVYDDEAVASQLASEGEVNRGTFPSAAYETASAWSPFRNTVDLHWMDGSDAKRVAEWVRDMPDDETRKREVFPAFWAEKQGAELFLQPGARYYKNRPDVTVSQEQLEERLGYALNFTGSDLPTPVDVEKSSTTTTPPPSLIVITNIGSRYYNANAFECLAWSPGVHQDVFNRFQALSLHPGQYDIIHVRGSDRVGVLLGHEKKHTFANLDTEGKERVLQTVVKALVARIRISMHSDMSLMTYVHPPLYLTGDDADLIRRVQAEIPRAKVLDTDYVNGYLDLVQQHVDEIKTTGATPVASHFLLGSTEEKELFNRMTVVDWWVLVGSRKCWSTFPDSVFFGTAQLRQMAPPGSPAPWFFTPTPSLPPPPPSSLSQTKGKGVSNHHDEDASALPPTIGSPAYRRSRAHQRLRVQQQRRRALFFPPPLSPPTPPSFPDVVAAVPAASVSQPLPQQPPLTEVTLSIPHDPTSPSK
jgi:hypothetical protein